MIRKQRKIIFIGIVLVICVALLIWLYPWRATSPAPQPPEIVTYSTDKPEEAKPNPADYTWKGDMNMPKSISLPSIGAEGFVQRVGVDQHKQIAVPTNVHVAGWYVESRSPGSDGLSIIDGHLDGPTAGGIFANLANLSAGDQFTLTFGDDSKKSFVVRRVQTLPAADAAAVLFSQDPAIGRQLNLITCGGAFNKPAGTYDDRVVVVAEAL